MREGPDLIPNRLEHGLPRRRVPAVPGGVRWDRAFDRCHDEFEIEIAAELGVALDVGGRRRFAVLARPILVAVRLPTIRPGRRMRTTRIANRVGRIGLEKDSPFLAHQARNVLRARRVTAEQLVLAELPDLAQTIQRASSLSSEYLDLCNHRRRRPEKH